MKTGQAAASKQQRAQANATNQQIMQSSRWQDPQAGPEDITVFAPTFKCMVVRRLERQFGGTIKQPRRLRTLLITTFVLMCTGLVGFSLRDGVHLTFSTNTAPLFCIIALCLLFAAISALEVLRWCIYWVLLGAIGLLVVNFLEGYRYGALWVSIFGALNTHLNVTL